MRPQRGAFSRDSALKHQTRRSADSVASNIAEGFDRDGQREFAHFLSIARGSLGEVKSHLHTAHRVGWLTREAFERLYAQADEVGRVIGGLQKSVRSPLH